jgi:regulator of protease activity HflC (stomatin/prohibitin superfamily)
MDAVPSLKATSSLLPDDPHSEGAAEQNILQHLLQVESEAATLVDDAQAEADRRLAEGEKQNRQHYDDRYSREVAELDALFEKEIAAVKEDYRKQLEAYRESLDRMMVNRENFSRLAERLLFECHPLKEE